MYPKLNIRVLLSDNILGSDSNGIETKACSEHSCPSTPAEAISQALKLTRQLAMRLSTPNASTPPPQPASRPLQQQLEALLVSDASPFLPHYNSNSSTQNGTSSGGNTSQGERGEAASPTLVAGLVSTLLTVLTGPGAHPLSVDCKGALAALLSALLDSNCQVGLSTANHCQELWCQNRRCSGLLGRKEGAKTGRRAVF